MAKKRITIEVDDSKFFDFVAKMDRSTVGDRFVELVLAPDSLRTQVGLTAAYGVEIISVDPVT